MGNATRDKQIADLRRLIDISRHMSVSIELDPLLKRIEEAALEVLDCERASVFLYDRNARELFSKIATGVSEIRFPADKGIAGEAAQTRRTINVPDAYRDSRFNAAVDRATGYRTRNILTVAMVGYDGELVGVLQLLNKRHGGFDDEDERLAETLSALAGVAVQRQFLLEEKAAKQKLERDLDLAREIQQGYLPDQAPQVAGFDIAGWNKPADQTGGDAYDFIVQEDGPVGLLIADATGHGVVPALMAAECRALLRALASTTTDLATIMQGANAVLTADLQDGRFVTACLAFLDPAAATIDHISAGQGPLIHYLAADDHFVELPASTFPMGITREFPCEQGPRITLEPGDLFILVTDGFLEWARADGEQFGRRRLREVIRLHRGESCGQLIHRLHQAVVEFGAGTRQEDDLTAIVVKRSS